jgi:hypothetical protein
MATTEINETKRTHRTPRSEIRLDGLVSAGTRSRTRVALFAIVPLLAGAIAASVLWQQPMRYESTLRVIVPRELSSSASGIGLYLADLQLQVLDPEVATRVAQETGISPHDYQSGIGLRRVGQSSSADFTFTSDDPDKAAAVVETAASAGLRSLATEGLPFAKREVELAEQSYKDAVKHLTAFRTRHGVSYPEEQYQQAIADLESAKAQRARAEASGDTAEVARAESTEDELTGTLESLQELLPEYQTLDDARVVALELRSSARDRLASKRAEIRLTRPENVRHDITTSALSRLRRCVQGAIVAMAAGLFALFVLLILPDVLRSPHRQVRQ